MPTRVSRSWPRTAMASTQAEISAQARSSESHPETSRQGMPAVMKTLAGGEVRTPDMGGSHRTYEVGNAVRNAILK